MKYFICRILFIILVSVAWIPANARPIPAGDTTHLLKDTLKGVTRPTDSALLNNTIPAEDNTGDSVEYKLLNTDDGIKTTGYIKALFHFLKSTKLKNASRDKRVSYRLYFRLAKNFARIKLYPLAMQCYYQTLLQPDSNTTENDSFRQVFESDTTATPVPLNNYPVTDSTNTNEDNIPANALALKNIYDYMQYPDTFFTQSLQQKWEPVPVSNDFITSPYNNGKKAAAYTIVLHVKQPVPGKRKPFTHLNNVGHFFITLIKYNADTGWVTRTFGCYPKKDNFFAATPLHPGSGAVLKNDSFHDWDEAIGKFISCRRFDRILRLIDRYNGKRYHLNKNNCTDFGLYAAAIAGVFIDDTKGAWPLDKGNNPANAGQSILEGKILNEDTGNAQGLFICTNVQNR